MKWIYGLLCLVFLILFHEFGHFLAARLFGVKVESFSIGFGPVLFHKNIKGTDFRISLFPLGGYCGMKGEKEVAEALENNYSQIHADKDSLYGIHPLKRGFIGFAGPLFNFLFASIAYSIIFTFGYSYYTYSNKIILADELDSSVYSVARQAGIKTGDIIISINGKETKDFSDIYEQIAINPDKVLSVKVLRNEELLDFVLTPQFDKKTGTGKIGIAADSTSLIKKDTETYNFFVSFYKGIIESLKNSWLTIKSISLIFKGAEIENTVSGPVRVTDILGSSIQQGFTSGIRQGIASIMSLTAIISISLFILNLLPIPILDGGLILFALIEFFSHKKINPKIQYYVQFIGLSFIAVLFIIGFSGDIMYILKRGFNK